MKKEDTFDFLLRAAIPEVTEKKKLPEELRNNKDKEDYSEKKLVWECISKAHRDVLSGRKYVANYSSMKDGDINKAALKLYKIITGEQKIKLSSNYLINQMMSEEGYRIGTVQKLVNMTLKYMFLLQLYEKLEGYDIAEDTIDCPLDSIILRKLKRGNIKWTKDFQNDEKLDGRDMYDKIQGEIAVEQNKKSKSKISYDFENWQRF